MKKIFAILLACAFVFNGCANIFRDELTELHDQMTEILARVDQVNSNLEAVQALLSIIKDYDYIESIISLQEDGKEIGHKITFTTGKSVTIYHGASPEIGVKEGEDGAWYWTISGEWLLDSNGERVRADGVVPEVKIEGERWLISYDNGRTWQDLGKAVGEDGDSMFEEIIVTEGEVIFKMTDGNEFAIPKNPRVRLILDIPDTETGVLPGSEIQINYTLENATDSTFVTASSNGYYGVRTETFDKSHGRIIVTSPYKYVDGYINIMVSDGASYSFIKVVNFYEHKMVFSEGLEYYVSPHGGEIHIPFSTNFQYRFEVEGSARSWLEIDYFETRSEMRDGTLKVTAAMNEYEHARMGKIRVIPTNSTGDIYTEIIINQSSAYFSIDQSKHAVPVEGATIITNITSSRGLYLRVPEAVSGWLESSITQNYGDNYTVTTVISENESQEKRSATIGLYSSDGSTYMGSLEFVQSSPIEEEIANLVFNVRANWSNDFTAHLPIAGEYDCYVDWGDGQAEHVSGYSGDWENAGVHHIYDVSEPTSYTVRISGTVTALSSRNIKAPCIEEVVQWGKTNLRSISGAFYGDYLLKKICRDPYNALENIYNLDEVFHSCIGLEELPDKLFETCINVTNASNTFERCVNLKRIPEDLFAKCKDLYYLDGTFRECDALTQIPENLFAANIKITTMHYIFENCDGIGTIPEKLFYNNTLMEYAEGIFRECDKITSIPRDLFSRNSLVRSFNQTFYACRNLTAVPEGLFRNNKDVNNFSHVFGDCSKLTTVPVSIFDNNRKVTNFERSFGWCHELRGETPYTKIDGRKYHLYERHLNPDHFVTPMHFTYCFAGCGNTKEWKEMQPSQWFDYWN